MAFESVAALASFDITEDQKVLSVSPVLYDLMYKERDRSFLSRIPDGPAVAETKFSWWERQLRPQTVTGAEALTDVELDLDVSAGHADRLVVGAILMDEAPAASGERIQVTAIAGVTLTITRGYGGTTAVAHANGATYRIVGIPAQEMSSQGLDLLRHPSEQINYLQIFRRDLKASRSSQGVKTYSGYTLNARRLQEKLEEIRDELEQAALFGVPNATTPAGSDTQLRSTGGLFHFATDIDAAAYPNSAAEDIKALVDGAAKEIMEQGGDPNFFMAGGDIFGTLMDLDADKVRFEVNDGVRGSVVTAIRTKFGPVLDLVYDRWMLPTVFCVGDYRKVEMRMFTIGGVPHVEQLAKTKDGDEFMIIGELGFQVSNGADAFKVFSNVTVA